MMTGIQFGKQPKPAPISERAMVTRVLEEGEPIPRILEIITDIAARMAEGKIDCLSLKQRRIVQAEYEKLPAKRTLGTPPRKHVPSVDNGIMCGPLPKWPPGMTEKTNRCRR